MDEDFLDLEFLCRSISVYFVLVIMENINDVFLFCFGNVCDDEKH